MPRRLAWFSPLPPAATGIAAYSAELLDQLEGDFAIDTFVPPLQTCARARTMAAHEFVWRHRREPYDLVVYQLGNAAWHDYMWAYAAAYPGLVVLHDANLHQARARHLLRAKRFDDYRREFAWNHPDARRDFAEYAVEGLGGPVYYLWRMIGALVRTARGVAVHSGRVAADLREEFPGAAIDTVRMGVPPMVVDRAASAATRRELRIPDEAVVFAAFGKVTPEKRIGPILRALGTLESETPQAHLLLIGDAAGYATLADEIAASGIGRRVHLAGAVADADLPRYLGAADACLCLRWPTAEESSASWLRCLAAGRATVVTDLPHLSDIPTRLSRGWRPSHAGLAPVAVAVDLLEEELSIRAAMSRLAADAAFRAEIAAAGHAYWRANHRLDLMADDYRALIHAVARRPAPHVDGLPAHFTDDYSSRAREFARQFGVDVDVLGRPSPPTHAKT